MDDTDDGEGFAVRLEVLPWTWRLAAEDELKEQGARVPGLDGEGRLLVLGVEGADRGERDRVQREQHRVVVPQHVRRHRSDWNHRHLDHRRSLDAHFQNKVMEEARGFVFLRLEVSFRFSEVRGFVSFFLPKGGRHFLFG